MEISPTERALGSLMHGVEALLTPEMRDSLDAREESRRILTLARAFHTPGPEAPAWIAQAHGCATPLGVREHLAAPLEAITTHVQILDEAPPAPVAYLHPAALPEVGKSMDALFPQRDYLPLDELVAVQRIALGKALADVLHRLSVIGPDVAVVQALGVLREHASTLSAHTPDCALYDHVRLCAAAAACLPDAPGEARLTLLAGDLSGIQRYIFGTTAGAGGPARRLRARSATLALLSEVVGHRILDVCGLPLTNLLVATAGQLYLLLPTDEQTAGRLADVRREVARWLRDSYGGELVLHLVSRDVAPEDLLPSGHGRLGCGRVMRDLATQLSNAKGQPLAAALQQDGMWNEDTFVIAFDAGAFDLCVACRRLPARYAVGPEREHVCDLCRADYELGSTLPGATALAFYRDAALYQHSHPTRLALLPPYSIRVLRAGERPDGAPYLVAPLAQGATMGIGEMLPVFPRQLITRVPRDADSGIVDFDTLAKRLPRDHGGTGRGATYLGYLRADVDRLGAIFATGLRRDEDERSFDGLVQILALSRALDLFMSGYVQHLLDTRFSNVYPVFGGGDDLVLIGPWQDIVAMAGAIRDDFARYTANDHLTLSAGIAIVPPDLPVPRAAEIAGVAKKLAKDGETPFATVGETASMAVAEKPLAATYEKDNRRGRERNSLGLFGTQLAWDDLPALRHAVGLLTAPDAGVGGSFLHRLLYYGRLQREYRRGNSNALRYKMWLAYDVARNVREARGVSDAVRRWCMGLVEAVLTEQGRADMRYLEVVARWAILATRKGE